MILAGFPDGSRHFDGFNMGSLALGLATPTIPAPSNASAFTGTEFQNFQSDYGKLLPQAKAALAQAQAVTDGAGNAPAVRAVLNTFQSDINSANNAINAAWDWDVNFLGVNTGRSQAKEAALQQGYRDYVSALRRLVSDMPSAIQATGSTVGSTFMPGAVTTGKSGFNIGSLLLPAGLGIGALVLFMIFKK